jgi:hypothetical protein
MAKAAKVAQTIEEKLKIDFCLKYLKDFQDTNLFEQHTIDLSQRFDLILNDAAFEFKTIESDFNLAFAEILINSGKRKKYFNRYIIVYQKDGQFVAKAFDYSDNYFNNMSVKFERETPSAPSPEAQAFFNKLQKTVYFDPFIGDDIHTLIRQIKLNTTETYITIDNSIRLFTEWRDMISFKNVPKNDVKDDVLVQLFLCDLLNGTVYNDSDNKLFKGKEDTTLFTYSAGVYDDGNKHFDLETPEIHDSFWKRFKLPPTKEVYNYIAERRNMLFSDEYRRQLGAQYTPPELVKLQWEMLAKQGIFFFFYVVWLDFACGTCNLLVDIPDKSYCFVSTYEAGDVNICRANGFQNVMQYDFLNNDRMPQFLYRGNQTNIVDIIKDIKKQVVVVMNPPYEENKAYQFLNKIQNNIKNFTCFWYCSDSDIKKKDKRAAWFSHKFRVLDCALVNAEIFGLKRWGLLMSALKYGGKSSPVLSDFKLKVWETKQNARAKQWELIDARKGNPLIYKETITYLDYVKKNIIANNTGGKELHKLGYKGGIFYIDNDKEDFSITETNLESALVAAGTIWNSHSEWYDDVIYCPLDSDGNIKKFDSQMIADSILLALCYKSNKAKEGFSIFTEKELGLPAHSLKAMKNGQMFYDRFASYKANLSPEGIDLYNKTLEVYKYYFRYFGLNADKNVGLNELKLAIMQQKVNATANKQCFDTSITGNNNGSRIGAGSKWTPKTADRLHNTTIFGEYDKALVAIMTRQYKRFIDYGMIDAMPSCVR